MWRAKRSIRSMPHDPPSTVAMEGAADGKLELAARSYHAVTAGTAQSRRSRKLQICSHISCGSSGSTATPIAMQSAAGSDTTTARRRRSRLEAKMVALIAPRNPAWNRTCRDGDHPAMASRNSTAVSGPEG